MTLGSAFTKLGQSNKLGGIPTHGIIVVITVSAEELASFFMFECPCNTNNFIYGHVGL